MFSDWRLVRKGHVASPRFLWNLLWEPCKKSISTEAAVCRDRIACERCLKSPNSSTSPAV